MPDQKKINHQFNINHVVRGTGKSGKMRISKASRAGFTFNVGRVLRQICEGKYASAV